MRQRLKNFSRTGLWLVFLVILSARFAQAATGEILIKETLINKQPDNTEVYIDSVALSPDMHHFAYVAASDDGMLVVKDNQTQKEYHHIARGYPIFSPRESRLGYIADKDNKYYVVIDGQESPGYDGACCLTFSPNGKNTAYIAQSGEKQFVVLNGRQMTSYDMIDRVTGIQFSPDSKSAAYITKQNTEQGVRLVTNEKESPLFDTINEILFSPDSKRCAYIVTVDKTFYVYNGEMKEGPYDKAEGLTWSPDSAHLAYIAIKDDLFWVIDNNERISAGEYAPRNVFYKEGGFSTLAPKMISPVFSPDGTLMAYSIIEEEKFRNVIGKTIGPLFDHVSEVIFSPDSRHYAYLAVSQTPQGSKMRIMHDGTAGEAYDMIDKPEFSPDSRRLAYRAMDKGKWFMAEGGKAQKPYNAVGPPVFSPDSRKLAYPAIEERKIMMVVDNREETYPIDKPVIPPDTISQPCFSPDGRNLAYLVQTKPLQCLLVINGTVVKVFNAAVLQVAKPLIFTSDNEAFFYASFPKDNHFEGFRIDITINPKQ